MSIQSLTTVRLVGFKSAPFDYQQELLKREFYVCNVESTESDWTKSSVEKKSYKKAFRRKYQGLISKQSDALVMYRAKSFADDPFLKVIQYLLLKGLFAKESSITLSSHQRLFYFSCTGILSPHIVDRTYSSKKAISAVPFFWFSHHARVIATLFR